MSDTHGLLMNPVWWETKNLKRWLFNKHNYILCIFFLTSGLTGDWLLQGDVVNTDPHFRASLFQFTPGKFTLAEGWKEAFRIGSGGGWGLGGHGAQVTPLAKPAEGNDVRMKIWCPNSHADDIWKTYISASFNPECFTCSEPQQKDEDIPESFCVSASWISDTSGGAKRQRLHNFTYVNDEIQRNLEAKRKREKLFLHMIVNFSDTLSSTILSLPA